MNIPSADYPFALNSKVPLSIYSDCALETYITQALADLSSDILNITGCTLQHTQIQPTENAIILSYLSSGWEAYSIQSRPNNILQISGSDSHSLLIAIYDFIEQYLGVDPFYWWTGLYPATRDGLSFKSINRVSTPPSFKFRGWFINDEDLLTDFQLNGAGKRNIDYPFYQNVVHRDIAEKIAETAVRAHYNLIIPASFVDIDNPDEKMLLDVCAKRGLYLSMHHVEPLGVSAFTFNNYWAKQGKKYVYSYHSNRDQLIEVWRHYANLWSQYDNVIWQIGLRGIGDRPIWHADSSIPTSDADRANLINEAMHEQAQIITDAIGARPEHMTTTLWAEGAVFYKQGLLKIPESTTLVFSDNCAGWRMQQDFHQATLDPTQKYGAYYHHAIICGTHLNQAVPPARTAQVFKDLYSRGVHEYAILNVSNIREFIYGVAASSQILRSVDSFSPTEFRNQWVKLHCSQHVKTIANAYELYFNSYELHPDTQVALFNDGILCNYISRCINLFKKGGPTNPVDQPGYLFEVKHTEVSQHTQSPVAPVAFDAQKDAFWSSLSDMVPLLASHAHTLKLLAAQAAGFERVLLELEQINSLPSAEKLFLDDQLHYPAQFMFLLTQSVYSILLAKEAWFNKNDVSFLKYVQQSSRCLNDVLTLMPSHCHGKWIHWYDGCKKLNIKSLAAQVQSIRNS